MRGMQYESLIRAAHNCRRREVVGADVDIYTGLERNHARYTEKLAGSALHRDKDVKDLAFEYGVATGEVANNITIAIGKVQNNYENQLSADQQRELEDFKAELVIPSMEIIDNVVERIQPIMNDLGLYPIM